MAWYDEIGKAVGIPTKVGNEPIIKGAPPPTDQPDNVRFDEDGRRVIPGGFENPFEDRPDIPHGDGTSRGEGGGGGGGPTVRDFDLTSILSGFPTKVSGGDIDKRFNSSRDLLQGVQLDKQGLNQLQSETLAQRPGELSEAGKLQIQGQQFEEQGLVDRLSRQQAGQSAGAQSALARSGGLGSGARERLATGMGRENLAQQQEARRGGTGQRLGIGLESEQSRVKKLASLPGLQTEAFGAELDQRKAVAAENTRENELEQQRMIKNVDLEASKAKIAAGGEASRYLADKINGGG